MRKKRTVQTSIFEFYPDHQIGHELKAMSQWLDEHPELLDRIVTDLEDRDLEATGRSGMSMESILRCALLKQYRQLSYDELAFCLLDSVVSRSFSRLTEGWIPKKAALQAVISRISASTWEWINHCLLHSARQERIETGKLLRIDSTVTESMIHAPTDASLLWDSVRVLVRLLQQGEQLPGAPRLTWRNHQRVAKKRMRAIRYTRGADKKALLYRDLIAVTNKTLQSIEQADWVLGSSMAGTEQAYWAWRQQVQHFKPLIHQVIEQTDRRIFRSEKVAAKDKLFSLFEEHTDIVIKGRREIQYGHKLNLSTGRSGLVLDVVVERGNPPDSERFLPMLTRHIAQYGRPPRQMAADGGYASQENLCQAKALQVKDVAFHKKRGLTVAAMVKSPWVYRKLRNFRAGIEAGISCLKRAYGVDRCTWKGWAHFKAYVWSSVVAHNLALFGRLRAT